MTAVVIFAALVAGALPAGGLAAGPRQRSRIFAEACEGYDRNAGCTVHFEGTCVTQQDKRFCLHEGEGHGESGAEAPGGAHPGSLRARSSSNERKPTWIGRLRSWTRAADPCAGREDGEACAFSRDGQCAGVRGCPVFRHGELACEPWDEVPPERVTKPCLGKSAGSRCASSMLEGTCYKHEVGLVCRVWQHQIP